MPWPGLRPRLDVTATTMLAISPPTVTHKYSLKLVCMIKHMTLTHSHRAMG